MAPISAVGDAVRFELRMTLRILVVTDGAINLWDTPQEPAPASSNMGFTLREMARALWDAPRSLYPYTNFIVDQATHGLGQFVKTPRSEVDPETGTTRNWTQYDNFRFDDPADLLQQYDQLWLFGFWPGNPDPRTTNFTIPANRTSLTTAETNVIWNFMNKGGGVFATGDHALLGDYLCGSIPRVRQMRHWHNNVPSLFGSDRVDTIVPVRTINGTLTVYFDDQSDNTPKPLTLKRYFLWDQLLHVQLVPRNFKLDVTRSSPHSILCSPLGAINILPDHMHEGLVCEDDEVELNDLYEGHKEFPGGADRPTPEVIAWSQVRGGNTDYEDTQNHTVVGREVPTISVYDGQQARVGRIVVDSTFHNWLDINLRATGAPGYTGLLGKNLELSHSYVRNVAQWLATPDQRDWMRDGLFVHIVANTGGWSGLIHVSLLLGEHATNVLGQVVSECERSGIAFANLTLELATLAKSNAGQLALPTKEFLHHHIFGAMTEKAFELIPKLPKANQLVNDRERNDSVKEFEYITSELRTARTVGLEAFCSEWRATLHATGKFLDKIQPIADVKQ